MQELGPQPRARERQRRVHRRGGPVRRGEEAGQERAQRGEGAAEGGAEVRVQAVARGWAAAERARDGAGRGGGGGGVEVVGDEVVEDHGADFGGSGRELAIVKGVRYRGDWFCGQGWDRQFHERERLGAASVVEISAQGQRCEEDAGQS